MSYSFSLEQPPENHERPTERRWMWISLIAMGLSLAYLVAVVRKAEQVRPLQAGPVNHGPLPPAVRAEVLNAVAPLLDHADLAEFRRGNLREFRITGTPKPLLVKEFTTPFKPIVKERLRPSLTPYGDILSFGITNIDLPPARLRPLPEKP